MFKHARFTALFRDPTWTEDVIGLVLDETHCVIDWGKNFRRDFDTLDSAKAHMAGKPIFFCTATLTPSMLDELLKKFSFPTNRRFLLNLGCERHNVIPIVCRLKGPSDFEALDFILNEALEDPPQPLVPTLVYAEERETVLRIWLYLISKLPPDSEYSSQIEFMMASRDEVVKTIVLTRFMYGEVVIIVSTEAVGLVSAIIYLFRGAIELKHSLVGYRCSRTPCRPVWNSPHASTVATACRTRWTRRRTIVCTAVSRAVSIPGDSTQGAEETCYDEGKR